MRDIRRNPDISKHTAKHVLHNVAKYYDEARTLGMFGLRRNILRMFVGVLVSQGLEYSKVV